MKNKNNKGQNKTLFAILGLVALTIALISFAPKKANAILDAQDFISKYKTETNAVLVDVRTPAEYQSGHIDNAINIDYENPNFEDEVKKLDPQKVYFVYCRSGNRSAKSILIMENNSIKNIYELRGGISGASELLKY